MEQKNRDSYVRGERVATRRRTPSPEYIVDLTVDSPMMHRSRTPHRRASVIRLNHNHGGQQAESSRITSAALPDLELINCSNRLLPPKKRNRLEANKSAKAAPVIHLDDSTEASTGDTATRINDSVSGESNVLTCPICFEYLSSKRKPMSTRCGHVYCSECIEQTLAMSKKCPKCQSNIKPKSCIRLYL